MGHAGFILTGRAIADRARDLVLDGMWEEALALLTESLEGFSLDHAAAVLRGEATLAGRSPEVVLVGAFAGSDGAALPDDQADRIAGYAADLQSMHGATVRLRGRWMRPYGRVDRLRSDLCRTELFEMGSRIGWDDIDLIPDVPVDLLCARLGEPVALSACLRAAYDPRNDACVLCFPDRDLDPFRSQGAWVLFEEADPVPFWLLAKGPKTPKAAVESFLRSGGILEVLGASFDARPESLPRMPFRSASEPLATVEPSVASESLASPQAGSALRESLRLAQVLRPEGVEYDADALRAEIRRKAEAGGFLELRVADGQGGHTVHSVPKAPFLDWVSRGRLIPDEAKSAIEASWTAVCPAGLKMDGDDPVHTDWLVGAEPPLDPMDYYGRGPLEEGVFALLNEVQSSLMGFEVPVLAGNGRFEGVVVHPKPDEEVPPGSVLVVPHCGTEYFAAAVSAAKGRGGAAVIAARGGRMAHLCVVGLEHGLTILLDSDAAARYPARTRVSVDGARGRLRVLDASGGEDDVEDEDGAVGGGAGGSA